MAVVIGMRVNDMLRSVAGQVRRVLAKAVQRSQVARRHWLGVGLQEGRVGRSRSIASACAGVSTTASTVPMEIYKLRTSLIRQV